MRTVVITGGSRGIGAALVRRFTAEGDRVEAQVAHAFRQIPEVDVLINNAGIADWGPINWVKPETFRRIMDVNVTGTYLCIQAALPSMLARKDGVILNTSSMWGLVGASCEAAYAASKAAVIGLTKSLAKELGPSGIRVNAVAPGVIETDMLRSLSAEDLEALRQETPLEALGRPADVADAMWFLASPQARFITGEVLNVSGGFVI